MAGKKRDNNYHVMRSTDSGEFTFFPWVTKGHAEKLATVLQEIEDHRRLSSKNKTLRDMPEAFNIYYTKEANG